MAVVVRDILYSLRGLPLLLWGASFANLFILTSECSSITFFAFFSLLPLVFEPASGNCEIIIISLAGKFST